MQLQTGCSCRVPAEEYCAQRWHDSPQQSYVADMSCANSLPDSNTIVLAAMTADGISDAPPFAEAD